MTLLEVQSRLTEIASISLQEMEDDAVLDLLKERKSLLVEEARLKQAEEEKQKALQIEQQKKALEEVAQKAKAAEQKKAALEARLAEINNSITPDHDDEQLLTLIQERKLLEAELNVFSAGQEEVGIESERSAVSVTEETKAEEIIPTLSPESVEENEETEEKIRISNQSYVPTSHISKGGKVSGLSGIGEQRIAVDSSLQSSEYQGYLSELKANLNSLGTFLQSLPISAKRNRAFMLEVANIDPAYAMHYADKDTLKKDESFNVAIAGMNNQRNTGNPLSEMLPEMRTDEVVLAGVKNDFRNVRFVRPEMPRYKEIVETAKKGALETVESLKGAHDIQFLIPPVLQKDKAFMDEVKKLVQ